MKRIALALALLFVAAVFLLRVQKPAPAPSALPVTTDAEPQPSVVASVRPAPSTAAPSESEAERRARLLSNEGNRDDLKLSETDVYLFLQANQSNSVSLVTAFEASRNKEFLKIAAARFPDDPFVQSKVLLHDVFPEERSKWIEAMKKSSPENALPYMFAAREAVNSGDVQRAINEIAASEGKAFNDFTRESAQGLEEAYLLAGRSLTEAKALGAGEITLPHLAEIKKAGTKLAELAAERGAAGDIAGQMALLQANWQLGANFRHSPGQGVIVTDLVGLAMQNKTLGSWPQGQPAPFLDIPVADQVAANKKHREEVRNLMPLFNNWFPHAPEVEVVNYMDRLKMFGEKNALAWLKDRRPDLANANKN